MKSQNVALFLALVFFILGVCQSIAAAGMTYPPTEKQVALMTGSLISHFDIVFYGIGLMIMTALFSLLIGSIKERKNRFIVLGILLVLVVFNNLIPLLLTGTHFEGLVNFVTSLLEIVGMCKFPLAIILAGMLWFWPGNKISWKDSALCSGIVFFLGEVFWLLLERTGILPGLLAFIREIALSASGVPNVVVFVFFFISLINFILIFTLSWVGFRFIAKCREKKEKN